MSKSSRPSPATSRPGRLAWHRRVGVGFAVLFVVVTLTGIALNHTDALRLDSRRIQADWIYDWYGMNPTGEPVAYALGNSTLVAWGGRVLLNGEILGQADEVRGALTLPDLHLVATDQAIWVLTSDGQLVERLSEAALPAGEIQVLARGGDEFPILLTTSTGTFGSTTDLIAWQPTTDRGIELLPVSLEPAARKAVLEQHRGEGISVYRVLLDVHSGRFFGRMGVWLVDASAVALVFLTITGVRYALRSKRG